MNSIDWPFLKSLVMNIGSYKMNREMIGYTIEETIEPVKREDVISFATATKDDNPIYGGEDGIAPPFLLYKMIFPMIKKLWLHKNLRVNILRGVYAQQEITWLEPIKIGDQLKVIIKITNIYDTPVGELIEIKGEGFNDNIRVVESVTGYIVRSKRKAPRKKTDQKEILTEKFRFEIQTRKGQPLKFAEASGDNNFIHTNSFLARMAGLPGTIMHGACVMAMSCASLTDNILDNDIGRLTGISGRFGKPAFPGEKLTIIGYDSSISNTIPFDVFNPSGHAVFKNGLFQYQLRF